jgi:hypothetical protein
MQTKGDWAGWLQHQAEAGHLEASWILVLAVWQSRSAAMFGVSLAPGPPWWRN